MGDADRRIGGDRRRSSTMAPPSCGPGAGVPPEDPGGEARGSRVAAGEATPARPRAPGAPARLRAADRRRAGLVALGGVVGRVARALYRARTHGAAATRTS